MLKLTAAASLSYSGQEQVSFLGLKSTASVILLFYNSSINKNKDRVTDISDIIIAKIHLFFLLHQQK